MNKRSQNNIGQSAHTSVKIHQNPGGKSNWSFGWGQEQKKPVEKNPQVKYHNESHFQMNDNVQNIQDQQKKREEERKRKQEEINNKLPSFDPKNGNKTTISFGQDKTDYRRKDQVFTSVKVHNPPGGKSSIQFG